MDQKCLFARGRAAGQSAVAAVFAAAIWGLGAVDGIVLGTVAPLLLAVTYGVSALRRAQAVNNRRARALVEAKETAVRLASTPELVIE